MKSRSLLIVSIVLLAGCHRSPIDRAKDAANPTALGQFGVVPNFRVFSNELMTGGGAFEYPGGDNQTLAFDDRSNPLSERSIRYAWNGQPTFSGDNGAFAGFTLMYTPLQSQYDPTTATPGRDLSAAHYSKITFYARGSLSTNTVLKVEGPDDAGGPIVAPCITLSASGTQNSCGGSFEAPQALTGAWRQYTLHIPNSTYLASIKDFVKATFVYNFPLGGLTGEAPGQGGTVYLDQIQYEP